jgi:pimeloyl-ACP methyl ester carboxylesterase
VFRVSESEPQFLEVGGADDRQPRRIAYRAAAPAGGDTSLFGCRVQSDIRLCCCRGCPFGKIKGLGCTRFDYSGHGLSSGPFEEGTIGAWLEEAEAVFSRVSKGRQIVVGSSLGGYIALLLLRRLMQRAPEEAARLAGLVLIAPAWDMTEELMWKQFPLSARRQLQDAGVYMQPSEYGEPYAITRQLIAEGTNSCRQALRSRPPRGHPAGGSISRADRAHAQAAGLLQGGRRHRGPLRRAQAFPRRTWGCFSKNRRAGGRTST